MELTDTFGGGVLILLNYDPHYETCQGNFQMVLTEAKAFQT